MQVLILDPHQKSRDVLAARVQESLRQTRLRRADVVSGDFDILLANVGKAPPSVAFLGPGCYDKLEAFLSRFRSFYPKVPVGVVLENAIYAAEAIDLRRLLAARIIAVADVAQMAQFLLDCSGHADQSTSSQGVISVAQCKGGVGATTIAAGIAECWARHDLSVALVELDDVNPHLTEWAQAAGHQRKLLSELLQQGGVPSYRVPEIATPVKSLGGKLAVVGLPEFYQESFHYKADILEGSPSSADFVRSLTNALQHHYDVIVLDLGRSWGVASFAALTLSQNVLFTSGNDALSLGRSLKNLYRFYRESEDVAEFDFAKWQLVLNDVTLRSEKPDVKKLLGESEFFSEDVPLVTIPHSERARNWSLTSDGFYGLSERTVQSVLEKLTFSLLPFRSGSAVVPASPRTPPSSFLSRLTSFLG